ncbi:hypothetical protein TRFO_40658 [Tritrichomonas foetus]|uniref:Uncharacterized protein n=1 Tax=Tritrichomonas foetus TaxID=1144522 RepID=A0A1J4J037_9EUKA|nr:hypothetical protein TRFO_40658 [Tritrichomonas foetus]|eukprot:OHS93022.1 hypothetical protein TRFO_40658 [Tritrichomonas foetus]
MRNGHGRDQLAPYEKTQTILNYINFRQFIVVLIFFLGSSFGFYFVGSIIKIPIQTFEQSLKREVYYTTLFFSFNFSEVSRVSDYYTTYLQAESINKFSNIFKVTSTVIDNGKIVQFSKPLTLLNNSYEDKNRLVPNHLRFFVEQYPCSSSDYILFNYTVYGDFSTLYSLALYFHAIYLNPSYVFFDRILQSVSCMFLIITIIFFTIHFEWPSTIQIILLADSIFALMSTFPLFLIVPESPSIEKISWSLFTFCLGWTRFYFLSAFHFYTNKKGIPMLLSLFNGIFVFLSIFVEYYALNKRSRLDLYIDNQLISTLSDKIVLFLLIIHLVVLFSNYAAAKRCLEESEKFAFNVHLYFAFILNGIALITQAPFAYDNFDRLLIWPKYLYRYSLFLVIDIFLILQTTMKKRKIKSLNIKIPVFQEKI